MWSFEYDARKTGFKFIAGIDEAGRGPLAASLKSMERAVNGLSIVPDYLLIDGKFTINSQIAQKSVIKGDSKRISIAAASIIAKVTRDAIMQKIHFDYLEYGFDRHKGYPTKAHRKALVKFGPCPWHRKSFKGVKPEG